MRVPKSVFTPSVSIDASVSVQNPFKFGASVDVDADAWLE